MELVMRVLLVDLLLYQCFKFLLLTARAQHLRVSDCMTGLGGGGRPNRTDTFRLSACPIAITHSPVVLVASSSHIAIGPTHRRIQAGIIVALADSGGATKT
jgi:hypothetical protein